MMGASTVKVTDANFEEEVARSSVPVLVDFWAEWCGPCRLMSPILEEVAPLYEGRLKVGKLNVDENQEAPTRFGVMNIPTLVVFKNGREVERIVGALGKSDLQKKLDRALSA